jgi:hypothetical protein
MSEQNFALKRHIMSVLPSEQSTDDNIFAEYWTQDEVPVKLITAMILFDAESKDGEGGIDGLIVHGLPSDGPGRMSLSAAKALIEAMKDAVALCELANQLAVDGKSHREIKAELLRQDAGTDTFKQVDVPRKRDIVIVDLKRDWCVCEGSLIRGLEQTITFNKRYNNAFEIVVRDATAQEAAYWEMMIKYSLCPVLDSTSD